MSYIALYRKWRPLSFDEVVGQEMTVKALSNTVKSGSIAHAYLFCGTRGTGKTSIAKIFSRAVNCLHPVNGNPCNECEICKGLLDGSLPDVMEIDAASNNGVDKIRAIIEDSVYSTFKARYRVYIIDEVHMLSQGAFNALLKTLEEPPENVIFILATTEPQKLPATVISRCIRFNFTRIPVEDVKDRLAMICDSIGVDYDEEALYFLARKGEGALRDSISLLDQTISSSDGYITLQKAREATGTVDRSFSEGLARAVINSDGREIIPIVDRIFSSGIDPEGMVSELISVMRDILVFLTVRDPKGMVESDMRSLKMLSEGTGVYDVVYMIRELSSLENRLKWSVERKTVLEAGLISLCDRHFSEDTDLETRVTYLEQRLSDLAQTGLRVSKLNYKEEPEDKKKEGNEGSDQEDVKTADLPKAESLKSAEESVPKEKIPSEKVRSVQKPSMKKMDEHDKMDLRSALVNRQKSSVAALIDVNADLYVEDETVFVVFGNETMMQIINNDKNRELLNESLTEVYAKKMTGKLISKNDFEKDFKFREKNEKPEQKPSEPADSAVDTDETLKAIMDYSREAGFTVTEE